MHRPNARGTGNHVTHDARSHRRLLALLGNLCNGCLTEAEGHELESLLEDDPRARAEYANYLTLHASLSSEASSLLAPANEAMLSSLDPVESESTVRVANAGRGWRVFAVAASLAAVALFLALGYALGSRPDDASPLAERQLDDGNDRHEVVAQITGTHNCLWDDDSSGVGFGSQLAAGQRLSLQEGLAEITFSDGATLLVEGPAEFVVTSPKRLALDSGRLAAVVPKKARGFRVRTAALELVDVDADFGLMAQRSGAAELHVFNGTIRADVLDSRGDANQRLQLNVAEAARVNPVSTSVVEFPADEAQFVRSIVPSTGPRDGLLAYESFQYPTGPLSAQNGGFGWAGPWFSIAADESAGPDSNRVNKGSLSATDVVPAGNHAAQTGQRNRIRRSLATSVGGVFDAAGLVENQDGVRLIGRDGSRVYLSFIQRVSAIGDGFYGFELHRGDGNPNRVLCIGHGADGAGYAASSNTNVFQGNNAPLLGPESVESNFFVVRITFGVDNKDTLEILRNPRSSRDEKACDVVAALRGNFSFDRISIANFDGSKTHEIDEIRVGTHFLAVTGRWGSGRGQLFRRLTFQDQQRSTAVASSRLLY